jgi:hypothetical protein
MNLVTLFLASILAGYALTLIPAASIAFIPGLGSVLTIVGGITMIIFSLAVLYQGGKALLKK